QTLIEKGRRAEGDFIGEDKLSTDRLSGLPFERDSSRVIAGLILVVGAFCVDVRPEQADRLDRRSPFVDGDIIDAVERSNGLCPERLGEDRPMRTFVHVAVGRNGDDQDLTRFFGLLKMPDVADMKKVEDAMTLDNLPAPPNHGELVGELVQ